MKITDRKLRNLRPSLKSIAPLTFWISVGFAFTNFAVWWLLTNVDVTAIKTNPVPIVGQQFFTYDQWGLWFLFLALFMVYALAVNSWKQIRLVLVLGLVSKLIWAYALLYMILHGIPAFATFILWAFLAWTQAWTIIYFAPVVEVKNGKVEIAKKGLKL